MDKIMADEGSRFVAPFNGAVEIGLRVLAVLNDVAPVAYSLQRLVILDYLVVHSDDVPNGPIGLHPQTPHRSGELLVRRNALQEGLLLYQSRGLIERRYEKSGVFFAATEQSASFLDALDADYIAGLRERAAWLANSFSQLSDAEIEKTVRAHLGEWGAEFVMESVLWDEESS